MLTSVAGLNLTAYAGAYDTTATARDYVLGTTTTGFFSDNDETDFLKVDVPQSGKINFTTEGSKEFGFYIIYPSNNLSSKITYFCTDYNRNLGKAYDDTDSIYLVSGTYYFEVSGYSNNSYTISTTFTPANESFAESLDVNNNIIGNANHIALDTTYNGMLAENDEVDFYLFTVPSGTQIINISADNYIDFSVYSTNGKRLAGEWYADMNDSTGRADRSESVSLDAGTYCLKIRSYYSSFYSFSINSPHQHAYNYSYTVAPTYTTKGYDIFACSCGDSYATNYTPVKKLGKVKLNSVSSVKKKHSIIAKWNKKSHASGYQIYYSRNKNFKKTVAKVLVSGGKRTSYKGKNFTKGKTYYVKVRAYKNVDGKRVYGKWSDVKRVKCK